MVILLLLLVKWDQFLVVSLEEIVRLFYLVNTRIAYLVMKYILLCA